MISYGNGSGWVSWGWKGAHDEGVGGAHAVESQVESAEFLVDAFVEDPVQVEAHKVGAIAISHRYLLRVLHQVFGHHLIVFSQRDLRQ